MKRLLGLLSQGLAGNVDKLQGASIVLLLKMFAHHLYNFRLESKFIDFSYIGRDKSISSNIFQLPLSLL